MQSCVLTVAGLYPVPLGPTSQGPSLSCPLLPTQQLCMLEKAQALMWHRAGDKPWPSSLAT